MSTALTAPERPENTRLHSIRRAADVTDLSPDTIRRAVQRRELRAKRVGRDIRIYDADLWQWIDSMPDAYPAA